MLWIKHSLVKTPEASFCSISVVMIFPMSVATAASGTLEVPMLHFSKSPCTYFSCLHPSTAELLKDLLTGIH